MLVTPINHPCTGQCYTPPVYYDKTQESRDNVVELSLAEKLRKDVFEIELKPLQSKVMHNCVSLPCGYPVYGCSCGQKDVIIQFRSIPSNSGVNLPEIFISGHHTQKCLSKVGKTVEEVYEEETLITSAVKLLPSKSNRSADLSKYFDYDLPYVFKGVRGKSGKKSFFKKSPKRGRKKSDKHHIDVRVSDTLPVSRSDSSFWDTIIGQTYNYGCACGIEYDIRLQNSQMAFNSDFKCSNCGEISNFSSSIMIDYEIYLKNCMWDDHLYCGIYCYCESFYTDLSW